MVEEKFENTTLKILQNGPQFDYFFHYFLGHDWGKFWKYIFENAPEWPPIWLITSILPSPWLKEILKIQLWRSSRMALNLTTFLSFPWPWLRKILKIHIWRGPRMVLNLINFVIITFTSSFKNLLLSFQMGRTWILAAGAPRTWIIFGCALIPESLIQPVSIVLAYNIL